MQIKPLTVKQQRIVDAILYLTEQQQYPPTILELAAHLKLSASTVGGYLVRLVRKGVLLKSHHGLRTLRVVEQYRYQPTPQGNSTLPVMNLEGQIEYRPVGWMLPCTRRSFLLDVTSIGRNTQDVQAGDRIIVDPGRPPRVGFPCVVIGTDGRLLLVESFTSETLKLPGKYAAIVAIVRPSPDQLASRSAAPFDVDLAG